jgi:hypothetical protein
LGIGCNGVALTRGVNAGCGLGGHKSLCAISGVSYFLKGVNYAKVYWFFGFTYFSYWM